MPRASSRCPATSEVLTLRTISTDKAGETFVGRYLRPMASAIWSCSIEAIDRFPAQTLVRFLHNHGMLSLVSQPTWKVLRGGSPAAFPGWSPLEDDVHLDAQLLAVRRHADAVELLLNRPPVRVDEVVFACHGDQVLPLLADPRDTEREVFRHFTTTANETWLHTGRRAAAEAAVGARVVETGSAPPRAAPSMAYDLNRLQGIDGTTRCASPSIPDADRRRHGLVGRFDYRHRGSPWQRSRRRRGGARSAAGRTHYCGAYWRYGFHGDGVVSAVRVARDLGVAW